ncbi:MAG: DNA-directed RNA polymerase subunit omega [Clostridiales bacterium]|nr:DNA-directed RNA polymerase subunit omega [Clostridiales bacterium]MCD8371312.1 DNA-directed RNA polymerase subunit omega [Clostridiales bacterium]
MLYPSYQNLIQKVNSEVKPGEHPVVQSRYSIVLATARRARQLIDGDEPMVPKSRGRKPLSIAIEELYEGRVRILPDSSVDEDFEETQAENLAIERNNEMFEKKEIV